MPIAKRNAIEAHEHELGGSRLKGKSEAFISRIDEARQIVFTELSAMEAEWISKSDVFEIPGVDADLISQKRTQAKNYVKALYDDMVAAGF
jgi:hypothetical protein